MMVERTILKREKSKYAATALAMSHYTQGDRIYQNRLNMKNLLRIMHAERILKRIIFCFAFLYAHVDSVLINVAITIDSQ
jgi:hypothetical protein